MEGKTPPQKKKKKKKKKKIFLVKTKDLDDYARLTAVLGTTKTDWHIDPTIGKEILKQHNFECMEVQ